MRSEDEIRKARRLLEQTLTICLQVSAASEVIARIRTTLDALEWVIDKHSTLTLSKFLATFEKEDEC